MIKYLQKQEYSSRTKVFIKEKVEHVTFNFTLENQVHRQGEYFNDKWVPGWVVVLICWVLSLCAVYVNKDPWWGLIASLGATGILQQSYQDLISEGVL